jgi:UDPglucose 6-dehydrogenase
MARITFFGAGYAGLVSGACLAELGHTVVIRDVSAERIELLEDGRIPFHEPGLELLIAQSRQRLSFTLSVEEAVEGSEFLFVCVGTPPTPSGDADLSAVWSVIEELPADVGPAVLVMKSTVPVGTGEKVRAALDARGLERIGYASCPEFLAEGTAVRDFLEADRVVVGSFEDADGDAVATLHEGLDAAVVRMDVPSAEMVKLAANAYLATRVSFINEIANVCELVGADVEDVARGMGLDRRIGTHYLRAGIGYGGSCLAGDETVLVRSESGTNLMTLSDFFDRQVGGDPERVLVETENVEVLSWRPAADTPEFLSIEHATRRPYVGDVLEINTKIGRRVTVTPDHPFVVADADGRISCKLADELCGDDWLPIAQLTPDVPEIVASLDVRSAPAGGLMPEDVIVRPRRGELDAARRTTVGAAARGLDRHPSPAGRARDIIRTGPLLELRALGPSLEGAAVSIASDNTYVPPSIPGDAAFWRVVGLYLAKGHCSVDEGRHRLQWSFHSSGARDLVDEVATFWRSLGVRADISSRPTTTAVGISSRLLADWWLRVLGLGANRYEHRIPDLIWGEAAEHKRALLTGLWLGGGSWSLVGGGPSVVLEYHMASRRLADGMLRLLGDLGVVASLKIGWSANPTTDVYFLRIAGAVQVETMLDLVSPPASDAIRTWIGRQQRRIAPTTGYRRHHRHAAWTRVVDIQRRAFAGPVYSLEVPESFTFVTTAGLIVHNCFPKDMSFLKLLAGNSGYHFHLVTAVMEVNDLQMRRPVAKLQRQLGALRGKRIALLGLAFKPDTDDLREAPSLVLAARLLAEGADVVAWDPVADARELLRGVTFVEDAAEAVRGADAAVVVTEWPQLRELPWAELCPSMRTPVVIDGRNFLDATAMREAGYAYEGMGRASSSSASLPEMSKTEAALRPR